MNDLPIYQIKPSGDKYAIFKPDGSKVNEHDYETMKQAQKHLDILVAYGYCRR